jgi:hypothetical protein
LSADLIFLGAGTLAGSPLLSSRAWHLPRNALTGRLHWHLCERRVTVMVVCLQYICFFFLFVVLYSFTVYHGFNGLHGVHEREREVGYNHTGYLVVSVLLVNLENSK